MELSSGVPWCEAAPRRIDDAKGSYLSLTEGNVRNQDVAVAPTSTQGAWALLVDFAVVAGRSGLRAVPLGVGAAVLEGLSFSLLVPLLNLVWGAGVQTGPLANIVAGVFQIARAHTPMTRLLLLLAIFGAAMILRSIAVAARDVAVTSLQIKFSGALRMRLATRLAATRWEHIAGLRHARVTQLMGDIQRLAIGTQAVLRAVAAAAVLIAQCLVALVLAPVLA